MTTTIRGLGTSTPCHQMSQEEATELFCSVVCTEEKQRRLARTLFRKAGVDRRHTVIPHRAAYHWCKSTQALAEANEQAGSITTFEVDDYVASGSRAEEIEAGGSAGPTTSERMALYATFAPDLACDAATGALEQAESSASSITHLVTVSCTGFGAPGVDIDLIERLGLPRTTQRVNVGFMGCHGGINGLRTAKAICESQPEAKVLMCATELCSLHYRFQWDGEGIIGNALFADGAASLVMESNSSEEKEDWRVLSTGSVLLEDSKQAMSWSVGDHGFEMLLGSEIGDHIEAKLQAWMVDWLAQQDVQFDEIDMWAVHPGGPRILSAVEKSLELPTEALATSRKILAANGNMSSPTVFFILDALRKQPAHANAKRCIVLGFGPGLMAEVALLGR